MTTLIDEAKRILDVGQIYPSEIEVVSCDAKDPARTDDDVCVIRERKPNESYDSEGTTREISIDELFNAANLRNLERGTPRQNDFKNYYFRLDQNVALIRRGIVRSSGVDEDGIFYRSPGSLDWRRLSQSQVRESPEVKAALLPILRRTVQSRAEYDRLNARPRREGDDRLDYDYALNTAVELLFDLAPPEDAETNRALLQALPSLNADAAALVFSRLSGPESGMRDGLVSALVRLRETGSADQKKMATEELSSLFPNVSDGDFSMDTVVVPRFSWEGSGGVYLPAPLRRAPSTVSWAGDHEPVGSYVKAGAGVELFIGPRIDCARREGVRVGALGEVGRMLNGFGYFSFEAKIFAGNENFAGFLEGGVNLYPTGGFLGEGEYGESVYKPTFGGGFRIIPHLKYFPVAIPFGVRLDPTTTDDVGFFIGLGGAQ